MSPADIEHAIRTVREARRHDRWLWLFLVAAGLLLVAFKELVGILVAAIGVVLTFLSQRSAGSDVDAVLLEFSYPLLKLKHVDSHVERELRIDDIAAYRLALGRNGVSIYTSKAHEPRTWVVPRFYRSGVDLEQLLLSSGVRKGF